MHHSHVTPFVMQHATFLFTRKEKVKVINMKLTLIKDVGVLMNAFVLILCLCVQKHGFSVFLCNFNSYCNCSTPPSLCMCLKVYLLCVCVSKG